MAGSHGGEVVLAICPCARSRRASGLLARRQSAGLLIEWPEGEKEPIKYWLSTLPEDVAFRELVDIAKLRWRIERDYQELKQEVGGMPQILLK